MYPQHGYPTPPPIKKGVGGLAIAGMLLAASLVSCTVGYAVGSADDKTPQRESLAASSQSPTHRSFTPIPVPETTTPEPVDYTPKPSDFEIEVKEIEKTCFGYGAGCHITFQVKPTYNGSDLDEDTAWIISYKIIGGKEPKIGSFDMTGDGKAQIDERDFLTVSNSSVKLKAKVTQVLSS